MDPDPAPATPTASTVLGAEVLGPLAPLTVHHPPGTFEPTPASRVALRAVVEHRRLLAGTGLDWGTGVGVLALAAARIGGVGRVVGLELRPENVAAARRNVRANGLEGVVRIVTADGTRAAARSEQAYLDRLAGRVEFVLANPPRHPEGDGFGFRRRVLAEVRPLLVPGGVVFLSISAQYGPARIRGLETDVPGFRWRGVLATTPPVPFDLERPELLAALRQYAAREEEGGRAYPLGDPRSGAARGAGEGLDAREALELYRREGRSPLTRWQVHRFDRTGETAADPGPPT